MTIDDTKLQELLRDLAVEPPEPSTVEPDRAVRDGRRRIRVRGVATSAAAVVVVLATVAAIPVALGSGHRRPAPQIIVASPSDTAAPDSVPAPPGDCTAQLLPAPNRYAGALVVGMDPTGRYLVGRGIGPDGRNHPLLWTDGQPSNLDTAGTVAEVDGIAVNSAGVVAWSSSGTTWRYQAGTREKLDIPADFAVSAVTGAGDVVAVETTLPDANAGARWLTLPADGGAAVIHSVPPTAAGERVWLRKVDVGGTAIGNSDLKTAMAGGAPSLAFAWSPDGTTHPLTAPNGYDPNTAATDVSGDWVVGGDRALMDRAGALVAPGGKTKTSVVRWNLSTFARQPFPDVSVALGVNRYGWFTGADRANRPVLVVGDQVRVLPLPPGTVPDAGATGTAVSDDGRVVGGQAAVKEGVSAARWTCR